MTTDGAEATSGDIRSVALRGIDGEMYTVPKPYPKEFRDDVMNLARSRQPGQTIQRIAAHFGIADSCLRHWMRRADVKDGLEPGTPAAENATAA